jgi:hypothetical protein
MKKLFVILVMLVAMSANAQWQSDVRLTNDPNTSSTSFNNAKCIASNDNFVHVVWHDDRDGNWEIYYKRSTDGGLNWSSDIRLTNATGWSYYPSISVSGSLVCIVWEDSRVTGYSSDIFFKSSSNGGLNWSNDINLTNHNSTSTYPSIYLSGTAIHIVWSDNRDGNYEIYYKNSSDGGNNWGNDVRLTNNSATSGNSSISGNSLFLHIVWRDNRDGNYEIYYKNSTNGGSNWGTDTRLTNNLQISDYPSISVSGQALYVVWRDTRDLDAEIYGKSSTNGGLSWGTDTRLTNNALESTYPSIAMTDSIIHIIWMDYRDYKNKVYYKKSTDRGLHWSSDIRLTNDTSESIRPFISISGLVVHTIWTDYRNGNYEIYYNRNPTGNVGIQNISTETPSKYSLSQNYPNPFNSSSNLKFQIVNTGNVKLIVYDIMGKEVQTLVNERLQPGTYEASFDGSALTSGVYFYKLVTDGYTETKKMLLIK